MNCQNIQQPTSNIEHPVNELVSDPALVVGCWMFGVEGSHESVHGQNPIPKSDAHWDLEVGRDVLPRLQADGQASHAQIPGEASDSGENDFAGARNGTNGSADGAKTLPLRPVEDRGRGEDEEHNPSAGPNSFTLWQLVDSAFPTGGFAHSAGLEATWHHGEVRSRDDLVSFLEASLDQLGHAVLPFANAAHVEPDRLEEFDRLCEAFTTNHVANRASRLQGKALLAAAERIFAGDEAGAGATPALPCAHFAPVFGAALSQLGIPRGTAAQLLFFLHLRGVLAAAVRLNIIGPMAAQALQHRLAPRAQEILRSCQSLTIDDIAQTSPLLDLWQGTQDRLYSRLFQS